MGNRSGDNLHVTCPCCQAKLTVDPILGAVLSHEAPPKAGPNVDLTDAAGILAEQNRQREDKFKDCLLYTSPSPRDLSTSRMPSSA